MALFHDFAEARTGDLNYVNQQYVESDETKVMNELIEQVPFGEDLRKRLDEYKQRQTREALLVKDADQLELILSLREQSDIGNPRAEHWIPTAIKRLKTPEAQELARIALETKSDDWWTTTKGDSWWIHREGATGNEKRF